MGKTAAGRVPSQEPARGRHRGANSELLDHGRHDDRLTDDELADDGWFADPARRMGWSVGFVAALVVAAHVSGGAVGRAIIDACVTGVQEASPAAGGDLAAWLVREQIPEILQYGAARVILRALAALAAGALIGGATAVFSHAPVAIEAARAARVKHRRAVAVIGVAVLVYLCVLAAVAAAAIAGDSRGIARWAVDALLVVPLWGIAIGTRFRCRFTDPSWEDLEDGPIVPLLLIIAATAGVTLLANHKDLGAVLLAAGAVAGGVLVDVDEADNVTRNETNAATRRMAARALAAAAVVSFVIVRCSDAASAGGAARSVCGQIALAALAGFALDRQVYGGLTRLRQGRWKRTAGPVSMVSVAYVGFLLLTGQMFGGPFEPPLLVAAVWLAWLLWRAMDGKSAFIAAGRDVAFAVCLGFVGLLALVWVANRISLSPAAADRLRKDAEHGRVLLEKPPWWGWTGLFIVLAAVGFARRWRNGGPSRIAGRVSGILSTAKRVSTFLSFFLMVFSFLGAAGLPSADTVLAGRILTQYTVAYEQAELQQRMVAVSDVALRQVSELTRQLRFDYRSSIFVYFKSSLPNRDEASPSPAELAGARRLGTLVGEEALPRQAGSSVERPVDEVVGTVPSVDVDGIVSAAQKAARTAGLDAPSGGGPTLGEREGRASEQVVQEDADEKQAEQAVESLVSALSNLADGVNLHLPNGFLSDMLREYVTGLAESAFGKWALEQLPGKKPAADAGSIVQPNAADVYQAGWAELREQAAAEHADMNGPGKAEHPGPADVEALLEESAGIRQSLTPCVACSAGADDSWDDMVE